MAEGLIKERACKRSWSPLFSTEPRRQYEERILDDSIQAGQEINALISHTIGVAYLLNLVILDDKAGFKSPGMTLEGRLVFPKVIVPLTVSLAQCADRAIPYLKAAADQGYRDASKSLYTAYKALAKSYQQSISGEMHEAQATSQVELMRT